MFKLTLSVYHPATGKRRNIETNIPSRVQKSKRQDDFHRAYEDATLIKNSHERALNEYLEPDASEMVHVTIKSLVER